MKKMIGLMALATTFISFSALAEGQISFTTAEFSITKVSPMCPAPKPGQVSCMSTAGKVVVMATVGCLDKMIFSHFEVEENVIRAVSVVRADSDSMKVMCYRANTFVKEISVPNVHDIQIVNEQIHQ